MKKVYVVSRVSHIGDGYVYTPVAVCATFSGAVRYTNTFDLFPDLSYDIDEVEFIEEEKKENDSERREG